MHKQSKTAKQKNKERLHCEMERNKNGTKLLTLSEMYKTQGKKLHQLGSTGFLNKGSNDKNRDFEQEQGGCYEL